MNPSWSVSAILISSWSVKVVPRSWNGWAEFSSHDGIDAMDGAQVFVTREWSERLALIWEEGEEFGKGTLW